MPPEGCVSTGRCIPFVSQSSGPGSLYRSYNAVDETMVRSRGNFHHNFQSRVRNRCRMSDDQSSAPQKRGRTSIDSPRWRKSVRVVGEENRAWARAKQRIGGRIGRGRLGVYARMNTYAWTECPYTRATEFTSGIGNGITSWITSQRPFVLKNAIHPHGRCSVNLPDRARLFSW